MGANGEKNFQCFFAQVIKLNDKFNPLNSEPSNEEEKYTHKIKGEMGKKKTKIQLNL